MWEIILAMPGFYLYLGFLAISLLTVLWKKPAESSVEDSCNMPAPTEPVAMTPRCPHDRTASRPLDAVRLRKARPSTRRFSDLQAILSANYSARFDEAMRAIRRPTVWVRPPEREW
jgi:hypothetical protein